MKRFALPIWRLMWKLRSQRVCGLSVGDAFPELTLKDTKGRPHQISGSLPKQHTLLWFTNLCEDCRSKIPLLNELNHEAGDRFRILAVSILNVDNPLSFEVSKSCLFPILLDPDDVVGKRLGLPHPPDTCPLHNLFILDDKQRIVFRHHLSALSPEAFRKMWRDLTSGVGHKEASHVAHH